MIQAETLLKFFKSFQTMTTLTDITLDFKRCVVAGYTHIDPFAEGLLCLAGSCLQKLNLYLPQQSTDSQKLIQIFQALRQLTSLKSFHLDLSYCFRISYQARTEFISTLGILTGLTSLSLFVDDSQNSESLASDIAYASPYLSKLVNLSLQFSIDGYTTSDHTQRLFSSLEALSCLQHLHIRLQHKNCLSDAAFTSLAESLKKLSSLKSLCLNFWSTRVVTKTGVETLCCSLKELHNLSSLTLNLGGNKNIDQAIVDKIAKVLQVLPCLYYVSLGFTFCLELRENENSLVKLVQTLKETRNIHEIILDVDHTQTHKNLLIDLNKHKNIGFDPFGWKVEE